MGFSPFQRCYRFVICLLVFSLGLAACNAALPLPSPAPSVTPQSSLTPSPAPTGTTEPTATSLPPSMVLLVPQGAEPALAIDLQTQLEDLAARQGLRFQHRSGLASTDLQNTRLVVALAPYPGLARLALAAPKTQFLGVGFVGVEPASNLALTGGGDERPDQAAFLAGFMAALITSDWRVGIINRSDTPAGIAARNAFIQGVIYYCGLCRPSYPPFYAYPLYSEVGASGAAAEGQAAADVLINQAVQTVYVAPGAGNPELLEYLAAAGVNIIGSQAPPAGLSSHWIATLHTDLATATLTAAEQLLQDQALSDQAVPLQVDDVNPDLLSPGRLRLVQETRDKLEANLLDTRIDLQSGEVKP